MPLERLCVCVKRGKHHKIFQGDFCRTFQFTKMLKMNWMVIWNRCEDTGILTLHWSTYGYFRTVRTRKSTYEYFLNLHTHTTHRSHAHFTRHVHDWQAQFTRPIYAHNLHNTYMIYKHTLRAYNLRPWPTRTIYLPELRVQSTRPTYTYNIRLSLARTYYTS